MKGSYSDSGLQFERTALGHWRTTLAALVSGLLALRNTDRGTERVAAITAIAVALTVFAALSYRRQVALRHGVAAARHRTFIAMVACLFVLQLVAVLSVL